MDNTKNNIAIFNKKAKQYQDKFMELSAFHEGFNLFCQQIKKQNATVLEVGCGPGNITKYLLQKRPDLSITAIDLSENMLLLAKQNNPSSHIIKMDCRNILSLSAKFDAIMCGFCLPYLSKKEAIQFIANAAATLAPNGVLYISTMEADNNKSGFKPSSDGDPDEMFIYYHEGEYLTAALAENGFSILEMKRQYYPEQDRTVPTDLIILSQKL